MVERVAKALLKLDGYPEKATSYDEVREDYVAHWTLYADDARALIAAMREPTGAMCATGSGASENVIELGDVEYVPECRIERVWRAMIDEALKP